MLLLRGWALCYYRQQLLCRMRRRWLPTAGIVAWQTTLLATRRQPLPPRLPLQVEHYGGTRGDAPCWSPTALARHVPVSRGPLPVSVCAALLVPAAAGCRPASLSHTPRLPLLYSGVHLGCHLGHPSAPLDAHRTVHKTLPPHPRLLCSCCLCRRCCLSQLALPPHSPQARARYHPLALLLPPLLALGRRRCQGRSGQRGWRPRAAPAPLRQRGEEGRRHRRVPAWARATPPDATCRQCRSDTLLGCIARVIFVAARAVCIY